MNEDFQPFDDPSLKQAVKRTCGCECCPERLKRSILGLASSAADPVKVEWWRRPIAWRVAAGLVVALVGVAVWSSMGRAGDRGAGGAVVVPTVTLAGFVQRHEACAKDHLARGHRAADVPQDDFQHMGQALCAKLRVPVLAADLRRDGWEFAGAALCDVNGGKAAHLLFVRGKQELSVFSSAAKGPAKGGEADVCNECIRECHVAAFVTGGGVHCMVGRCGENKLRGDEVRELLRKHQGELVNVGVAVAGLE